MAEALVRGFADPLFLLATSRIAPPTKAAARGRRCRSPSRRRRSAPCRSTWRSGQAPEESEGRRFLGVSGRIELGDLPAAQITPRRLPAVQMMDVPRRSNGEVPGDFGGTARRRGRGASRVEGAPGRGATEDHGGSDGGAAAEARAILRGARAAQEGRRRGPPVEMYAGREHELMPDVVASMVPRPRRSRRGSPGPRRRWRRRRRDVGAGDVVETSPETSARRPGANDTRRPAGRPTPTRTPRRRTFASGPS